MCIYSFQFSNELEFLVSLNIAVMTILKSDNSLMQSPYGSIYCLLLLLVLIYVVLSLPEPIFKGV